MVTGNTSSSSNDVYIRPVLEDALSKLLDSIECENIFTEEIEPITTDVDFLNKLAVHKNLTQPEYEGWFTRRNRMLVSTDAISNQYQYEMVHGMMVTGMAFHGDFNRSYQYIQDKTEKLIWTLEKNKNILGNANIEFIDGVTSNFSFEQFGEVYMYRSQTTFNVHRIIIETSGRSFTG